MTDPTVTRRTVILFLVSSSTASFAIENISRLEIPPLHTNTTDWTSQREKFECGRLINETEEGVLTGY